MKQLYPVQRQLLSVAFLLSASIVFLPSRIFAQAQVCTAPVLVLTTATPAPVCSPQTVNLNNLIDYSASTLPGDTYFLFYDNSNNEVSSPSAISQSGTYFIKAISGACSDQKSVTVTINQTPVITTSYFPFCSNDQGFFSLNATAGTNTVVWNGNGVVNSGGVYYFQPLTAGPGTFNLKATNTTGGCQASLQVKVLQTPKLVLKTPAAVCSPQTVDLTKLVDPTSVLPAGTVLSYSINNVVVISPSAVNQSGTYLISAIFTAPDGSTCTDNQLVNVTVNQTPVITTSYFPFCGNDQGYFALNATAGTNTVAWNGDGVVNSGGSYYFQPLTAGAGIHTLVATNTTSGGCQASMQVQVFQSPKLVVKQPAAVCSPQTVDLTKLVDPTSVLPAGTVLSYSLNNVVVSSPSAVTQSGAYLISAIFTAPNGSTCTDNQIVNVTVNQTPVITTFFSPFCGNDQGYFALNATAGTNTVAWNGDGVVNSGGSYYFQPLTAGAGIHTLVATNTTSGGCQASMQVTVLQTPKLVVKQPAPVCSPQTVDLTKLVDQAASILPPGTSFYYLQNGVPVSTPSAISQSGTYQIGASVPTSNQFVSCSDNQYVQVTVNRSPVVTQLGIFCSNDPSTYNMTATAGTGDAITWNGDGVTNSNGFTFFFNPSLAGAGIHALIATNLNGGCQTTMQVQVFQAPKLVVKQPAAVCSPQTVDLTKLVDQAASILPPGTSFYYLQNGVPVSTPSAVSQSGTYQIGASVPTSNQFVSCSDNQYVQVAVNQTPSITPLQGPFCSNDATAYALSATTSTGDFINWNGDGVTNSNGASFFFKPSLAGVGTHTLIATNTNGGCQASIQATVLAPPSLSACPADITVSNDPGKCGAIVNYAAPSATAGCGSASLSQTGPVSGSLFPTGITVVTFTLKDAAGNTLTSCSFKVTVNDTEKPVITCNGDQNLNNDPNQCGASYSGVPTATDNCPGLTITGSRNDGRSLTDLYPIGATTITWTATDASGNTSTCTQKINVADHELPAITCPANLSQDADAGSCGAIIIVATPAATDNCGAPVVSSHRSDGLGPNAPYPIGVTTITWTATDAAGNTKSCSQTITVRDNEAPVINCGTAIVVSTDPGRCAASLSVPVPTATDNCGTPAVTGVRSDGQALTAPYPTGSTTITWTATDASGKTSSCTQTVLVSDKEKPSITAPPAINTTANAGKCSAVVSLGTPVTSDNCGIASVTSNAPANFPVGSTTVLWTATDVNGNINTSTQTVTVTDNEKPVVSGVVQKNFCSGGSGSYTVDAISASDNCGIASITYAVSGATVRTGTGPDASGNFAVGTSIITWKVTDLSGNVSTWQTKVVVDNAIVVSIPDAFAMATGAAANTVYLGYSPASSIKLKAVATGGTGTLTYLWSNGATTQTITVSPTVVTTYSVTVSDATGCSKASSKQIIVVDISCGTGKVTICCKSATSQTGQTLCVNSGLVPYYLLLGAKLGSCTSNPATVRVQQKSVEEQQINTTLSVQAYPNPSNASFTLVAKGMKPVEKAELIVYDVLGKVVEVKTVLPGQTFSVGAFYKAGVYVAELRQGDKKSTVKLVKQ
ncbi:MAG: HYR domain-containing protein [Flavisolibacter sp.]